MNQVILVPDNARSHTSLSTREAITTVGWAVLPHPTYRPDSAPSDFHLFGPLKDGTPKTQSAYRVRTFQQSALREHHTASHARRKKRVHNEDDFAENTVKCQLCK